MTARLRQAVAALVVIATVGCAGQTCAWGSTGHRIIGRLAMETLPPNVPAFLRTQAARDAIGELAREPDRWKAAGKAHDSDRDPGHFLDLGDDGRVLGGPTLAALPATREEYEAALRAAGADSWKAGYLPYSIIEDWQQLAKDFAYWRVDTAAAAHTAVRAHRAWLLADAREREALTLRDLGTLAHYVGDGSQPLHVSEHFNGWGPFPNLRGYTQDRVHAPFEGAFVRAFVSEAAVRKAMTPAMDCRCSIETRTEAYLAHTNSYVGPFYDLYKAHAFSGPDPRGEAFAAERLAAGASELRDLVAAAWRASARDNVGWPAVSVGDVEAGKVDPYDSLFGVD